jgi:protocatechuate 3,4-dioxygenase beta subunit
MSKDKSLSLDLQRLNQVLDRRRMLKLLGAASLLPIVSACGTSASGTTENEETASGFSDPAATPETCELIPSETAGPFPGDGTNGKNALTLSGIVRSDMRASLSSSSVAAGVPLSVQLKLVNVGANCAAPEGYAVYLWHCDQNGKYSMYDLPNDSYLRGVQVADANGIVSFQTVFPGCYSGRWPHMHFEIYKSLAAATNGANKHRVSQLAMPKAVAQTVYATTGYTTSVTNFAKVSLASDNVFSDGADAQVAALTGDTDAGFAATLIVGV